MMLPTAALQTKYEQWVRWRIENPDITNVQLAARWHTTPDAVSATINAFRGCGLSDNADGFARLKDLRGRLALSMFYDAKRGETRSDRTINLKALVRRQRQALLQGE